MAGGSDVIEYSEKIGKIILEKLHKKGWNVYRYKDNLSRGENIKNNLVEGNLELHTHYVLLPSADDPRDEEKVMNALKKLAIKLDREMSTIKIDDGEYEFTGFHLREMFVRLHTPEGNVVPYYEFLEALDTIVDTKK